MPRPCPLCNGTGNAMSKCHKCSGSGKIILKAAVRSNEMEDYSFDYICPECGGAGVNPIVCHHCYGAGVI